MLDRTEKTVSEFKLPPRPPTSVFNKGNKVKPGSKNSSQKHKKSVDLILVSGKRRFSRRMSILGSEIIREDETERSV